jgi:uncharacterized RmlC-like cupin family protein
MDNEQSIWTNAKEFHISSKPGVIFYRGNVPHMKTNQDCDGEYFNSVDLTTGELVSINFDEEIDVRVQFKRFEYK